MDNLDKCIGVDFNPPTPWGVGRATGCTILNNPDFNPPTPWGVGRIKLCGKRHIDVVFQSTHSVGSGTDLLDIKQAQAQFQSTHSVGSGTRRYSALLITPSISIHPLRGEWDQLQRFAASKNFLFQSTHSVGSGT